MEQIEGFLRYSVFKAIICIFFQGEEFLYRQDWGEQLVGKHLSVIVVCKLATETLTILDGLPESWTPGQVPLHIQY